MTRTVSLLCLLALVAGCSTQRMSYVPTTTYDPNDTRNITDEDIRKAFDAQPQIKLPVKLAWYNMGTDDFMASLIKPHPNVSLSYEIPKCLLEGARPYFNRGYHSYYYAAPVSLDLKAVRLLAARAKCDIVVLVGSRFEQKMEPNLWAVFNILILPALVTPWWDASYHYEAEALIFDVRNGYLYKHAKSVSDEEQKYLTDYGAEVAAKKAEAEFRKKGEEHLTKEIYALFQTEAK